MPVLITGAETALGQACVRGFLRAGGEVRAFVEVPAGTRVVEDLRRWGVKTAVGELDDEAHLEAALEQVHTVVHAAGGWHRDPADELDGVAAVVGAAIGARCKRIVWPSALGTDEPSGDAYLEACRDAEDVLADGPFESVVIRRGLTYGPDDAFTRALADTELDATERQAQHRPLLLDDLAGAAVAADRHRGSVDAVQVVVGLAGPDPSDLGSFADRLPAGSGSPLPASARSLLARSTAHLDALGSEGTPLEAGLRRTRLAAATRR